MNKMVKHSLILFFTIFNSTTILSRYIIFDINGLVESRESWIKCTRTLSGKYKLRVASDNSCFSEKSLGDLFTIFGVEKNQRDAFMKELWGNFVLEQHQKNQSDGFKRIKPILEQLSKDYQLGILTSNPGYVKEILKRGEIDRFFTQIWNAGSNNDISIENNILEVKTHQDFIVDLATSLEETPIFVVQTIDFAYSLASRNVLCIGGAWGFHSKGAFATYVPNIPVAETPEDLAHIVEQMIKN